MKHKIKMFAGVQTMAHAAGHISLSDYDFRQFASSHETRAFLAEVEVEVELPDFKLVDLQLEVLEQKLASEIDEANTRQANLRMQIQELKCLTHDVPEQP